MQPKQHATTGSSDLFRARLEQIINMKHELLQISGKIDWAWIDSEIAPLYSDKGRPGIETRFVIGSCCSSTFTDFQTKVYASAGCMTRISSLHRGSVLPA